MNRRQTNRAVCYALLIVCLIAAAILPFLAVISLSLANELYAWMPGISLNYELYSPWLMVLPVLSALYLLSACVKTVRSLYTGKALGYRVLAAPWLGLTLSLMLCIACARGGPFFGAALIIRPLLAAGLNICAMFLIGSLNKNDP